MKFAWEVLLLIALLVGVGVAGCDDSSMYHNFDAKPSDIR